MEDTERGQVPGKKAQALSCFTLPVTPPSFSAMTPPSLNQPFLPLCIRWPKYWSFRLSIHPSNEYSGWISLRTDRFDLLAVQDTSRSLDQHHVSKASVLWHSAFCWLQLSHVYGTPGKTIALTVGTFVCRVPSLLFSTLPRRLH